MDFNLGERERILRQEIAEFAQRELPPAWIGTTLLDQMDSRDWEFEMSMSRKLAQKGWLVIGWPKEYGGLAASPWEQAEYEIDVAYWRIPGTTMGISGVHWVGPCLMSFGTDEQRKKHLPLIASGDPDGVWCSGYSEPDAGSDLANLKTRAVKEGNDYIINGQKVWTSSAHRARWCWLLARTMPQSEKKHRGLSLLLVDMKSPGITVNPILNYYGRHNFNEVFFDNVRVPASNLVGEENKGWYIIMQALAFERLSLAPHTYGSFKRLMEEIIEYVKTVQCQNIPLSQYPMTRNKLTDMAIDLETLKLFAYQLTWRLSNGAIPTYEASRNKVMSDELLKRMALAATDILRIYSQVDPDSRWANLGGIVQSAYLGFPASLVAAGSSEIERSILAQFKLGLPKSY